MSSLRLYPLENCKIYLSASISVYSDYYGLHLNLSQYGSSLFILDREKGDAELDERAIYKVEDLTREQIDKLLSLSADAQEFYDYVMGLAVSAGAIDKQTPISCAPTLPPRSRPPEAEPNADHVAIGKADGDIFYLSNQQIQLISQSLKEFEHSNSCNDYKEVRQTRRVFKRHLRLIKDISLLESEKRRKATKDYPKADDIPPCFRLESYDQCGLPSNLE